MEKSYVALEAKVCEVCGQVHETGAVLMDRRLQPSLERQTVTGWGLCPEHQKLYNEGYSALVEATGPIINGELRREDAERSGKIAHLRFSVWERIFNIPIPTNKQGQPLPMVFVEPGVIDAIMAMRKGDSDGNAEAIQP